MCRLCTECGQPTDDKYSQIIIQKADWTGDLCERCWDKELERCKLQVKEAK